MFLEGCLFEKHCIDTAFSSVDEEHRTHLVKGCFSQVSRFSSFYFALQLSSADEDPVPYSWKIVLPKTLRCWRRISLQYLSLTRGAICCTISRAEVLGWLGGLTLQSLASLRDLERECA